MLYSKRIFCYSLGRSGIMKKFLLFFCLILSVFFSSVSYAYTELDIRQRAFNAPEKISEDAEKTAKYLTSPFDNDYDKMKVIAYWIASHIAYDSYKYDAGKPNQKQLQYHYNILQAKAGICTDFALLFIQMCNYAGVRNVKYVSGYALNNVNSIRQRFTSKELEGNGHAWNMAKYNGRSFYIDTTFMTTMSIGRDGKTRKSTLKHKRDIKKRSRNQTDVSTSINTFYFDFTPITEVKRYGAIHKERSD
jgi:hypothetical protein